MIIVNFTEEELRLLREVVINEKINHRKPLLQKKGLISRLELQYCRIEDKICKALQQIEKIGR
jgi:hypothetical protein